MSLLSPVRTGILLACCAAVGALLPALPGHAGPAAAVTVTKTTLFFKATGLGPAHDRTCDVVGDLYVPSTATAASPAPAILTTNGFGGSKDDQAALAQTEAQRGYVVLSYSGLGFGAKPDANPPEQASGCQIEINDPDWDGLAGRALISFLGGAPGIAFTSYDATTGTYGPADTVVPPVVHDAKDHDGVAQTDDPRVGMIGGSEGGEAQFAVAGVDPRLDMIIPEITWNDLSFSLGQNATTLPAHSVSFGTNGVLKLDWPVLFFGEGTADGVEKDLTNPAGLATATTCPGFDAEVCPALATSAAVGYPTASTVAFLRQRSVVSYLPKIKVPVLLAQGQADTLFELSEATATLHALQAQGTPVHMVWQSWGHSDSTPVPGEDVIGDAGSPEGGLFQAWFDHYLKGEDTDLGAPFEYYRDYDYTTGLSGTAAEQAATAAYASAPSYPVAAGVTYALSGTSALTSGTAAAGSSSFVAPADVGASYTETSAVDQSTPVTDVPGTTASYTLPAFTKAADVVGIPTATLHLSDPVASSTTLADELVVFLRLEDVQPDGTVVLPHRLIAAVRAPDLSKPVTIMLPGIVHQIPAGDSLRLVVAGSDLAYHGNDVAQPVTASTGPGAAASTLTVPILGATTATPPATVAPGTPAGPGSSTSPGSPTAPGSSTSPGSPTAPGSSTASAGGTAPATTPARTTVAGEQLAFTGFGAVVPVLALGAVGLGLLLRRTARRR